MGGMDKTKNIFDFGCQRSRRYTDYLVFHLPTWVKSGLENDKWIPHLRLNIALNALSSTFDADGEYKNGSIFVDLNEQQKDNLFKLLAANDITIDYGVAEARLSIEQRTRTPDGNGNVVGFIEDLVTNILSPALRAGKVTGFETESMLSACVAYKRSGRLP